MQPKSKTLSKRKSATRSKRSPAPKSDRLLAIVRAAGRRALAAFAPPPKQTVSQWADDRRVLSEEAAAEPGKWRTDRAEYLRGVMDAMSDPRVHTVACIKGSQVGWTEVILNVLGFHIDRDPCPLLVIQPTVELGAAWSKDRLAPMLRDTPAIAGRVSDPRSRDGDNSIRHKTFPGGRLTIVGANAPAGLASRPIRIVLADEVDRYPVSAGTEGDPLKLAAKRQITFWNRKTLVGSTPTTKETSVINREWERSDKRRFFVPCPECGHAQTLRWEQVRWSKIEDGPPGAHGRHLPETAAYFCEECGTPWDDATRWGAVSRGEWRATAHFNGVAGFHVPGFLSSWLTLSEIVAEFLEAKDNPQLLQVWMNTVLGQVWEEQGATVSADALPARAEQYDHMTLPDETVVLTAGVDVQDDRLEIQTIAWGPKEECWPCFYEVIRGDPAQRTVWDELDALLKETYVTDAGRVLKIKATAIDMGGHHGEAVLSFANARRGRRVYAVKGVAGPRPIWPKRHSLTKTKAQFFSIGVDTAKDAIYSRLRIEKPGPAYVHFPIADGFDLAYFEQLTSEQVVTRYREGRPYRVWVLKKSGARNEALDTFVMSLAALKSLPIRLDKRDRRAPAEDSPPPPPVAAPAVEHIDDERVLPAERQAPAAPAAVAAQRLRGRRFSRSSYMGR